MATIRGEGVRIEMQAANGEWVDITDHAGLVDEDGDAVFLGGQYEVDVTIYDLREVVETASGGAIAVKPRTEA